MKSKIINQGFNLEENNCLAKELIDLFNSNKYNRFTCLVAFASYGGVSALTPYIIKAKSLGVRVKIILGIDQKCTSKEALEEVLSWNVDSYIYFTLSTSIFHPKVYLFENDDFYSLIVGSNNLTEGGMVRNVECSLLVQDIQGTSVNAAFYTYWNDMLNATNDSVYPLTKVLVETLYVNGIVPNDADSKMTNGKKTSANDDEGLALLFKKVPVQRNPEGFVPKRISRRIVHVAKDIKNDTKPGIMGSSPIEIGDEVLIAEIGGGSRWKQVNFPVEIFESFFGATRGDNEYWINILNIGVDGTLGSVEQRQAVSVKSRNYRFEINCDETKGEYPSGEGRPIVIFVKWGELDFIYQVLLPQHYAYSKVRDYLYRESKNKDRELKRALVHVEALHVLYPELVM